MREKMRHQAVSRMGEMRSHGVDSGTCAHGQGLEPDLTNPRADPYFGAWAVSARR
jgi:hypothetical protein